MNKWIDGVEDKYPSELLDGRINAEASVIGLIWSDPLILDEVRLKGADFLSTDGKLFFAIARHLRDKGINEFNEVAVISNLSKELLDKFNANGGMEEIYRIMNVISLKNKESILDSLYSYNILLKLHKEGFNLLEKIEIDGKKQVPLEYFRATNKKSTDIIEWYERQLNVMYDGGYETALLQDEDLVITDEFLQDLADAKEYGLQYGTAGTDIDGNNMNVFPYLSSLTLGLISGASHYISGFSSSGKTAMWCSIIMALATNHKVLVICNEQSSKTWKINMILFILYKHYRYYGVKKSNLLSGQTTDQDKEMLQKAKEYFNIHYKGQIHFIQLAENCIDIVKSKIRYYALQENYSCVIYDTLKIADTNRRDKDVAAWEELVQYSRDLDILAKKYDLVMCASVQLAQSQKGSLFLDSNMLSGAKGIVEQLDTLLALRDVYKEELDPNSRLYCHPYQLIRDELTDKFIEKEYYCDPKYAWKMCFLTKSRNSENSTSSGSVLMFKFNGAFATFSECCWCRPKHGFVNGN